MDQLACGRRDWHGRCGEESGDWVFHHREKGGEVFSSLFEGCSVLACVRWKVAGRVDATEILLTPIYIKSSRERQASGFVEMHLVLIV